VTSIFAALAALACACSSAPEVTPLPPGERVAMSYRDENTVMSLRNAAANEAQGHRGSQDPSLKIASDDDVAKLLEALTRLGFFDTATSVAPPQGKARLVVERNGRTFVRARLPLAQTTPEEIEQFHLCVDVFRHVYDQTAAYRPDPNVRPEDFVQESERLMENARRATQRRSRS
jgi:hypothetical protein